MGTSHDDDDDGSGSGSRPGAHHALVTLLGEDAANLVDRASLDALLERRGYKPRKPPARTAPASAPRSSLVDADDDDDASASSAGGWSVGHSSASRATTGLDSAGGGVGPVELEAIELPPFAEARLPRRGAKAACAFLVERGSLEGHWRPPSASAGGDGSASASRRSKSRSKSRSRLDPSSASSGGAGAGGGADAGAATTNARAAAARVDARALAFVATEGESVGSHLLLTGQRSLSVLLRAGPRGCVLAALPHVAVARLARSTPAVYTRIASSLARRLRPSLPMRTWDRLGAEWVSLGAGAALSGVGSGLGSGPGSGGGGGHPDGVYVVVTGRVRLGLPGEAVGGECGDDASGGGGTPGGGGGVCGAGGDAAGGGRARVLGPGEAIGEDTVLRGGDGFGFEYRDDDDDDDEPRSTATFSAGGGFAGSSSSSSSSISRARAVRDAQLLWIPGSGVESLALCAPRSFVSLAWRMGARAAGGFGFGGDGPHSRDGGSYSYPHSSGGVDFAGMGVAAGIQSPHGGATVGGAHHHSSTAGPSGGDPSSASTSAPRTVAVVPVSEGAALALDEFCAAVHHALSKHCVARVADSASRLAEVGQAGVGALAREATAHWLSQLEASNDVVVLKADPFPSAWCVECARHADAILLVASSDDAAPAPEDGRRLQSRLLGGGGYGGFARRELVLLHASSEVRFPYTGSHTTASAW